ncbi:MAG TPA: hypothetical protein VMY88_06355, partial [Acidimicrobiales bacterium]|nr:hypothetical protein [Acidimicrobiales bacterium]
ANPGAGQDAPHLLDLYKFAVEMADRISSRRATANSFFLAVNAALTAILGTGRVNVAGGHRSADAAAVLAALIGIVLSATWWLLLRSYRDLSNAKWQVITRLEDRLDIRLYQDEWKILKAEEPTTWRRKYREIGLVERVVPLLFLATYAALAGSILCL